jgi:hypothetical protein
MELLLAALLILMIPGLLTYLVPERGRETGGTSTLPATLPRSNRA